MKCLCELFILMQEFFFIEILSNCTQFLSSGVPMKQRQVSIG